MKMLINRNFFSPKFKENAQSSRILLMINFFHRIFVFLLMLSNTLASQIDLLEKNQIANWSLLIPIYMDFSPSNTLETPHCTYWTMRRESHLHYLSIKALWFHRREMGFSKILFRFEPYVSIAHRLPGVQEILKYLEKKPAGLAANWRKERKNRK
jgi:hypothetical protein